MNKYEIRTDVAVYWISISSRLVIILITEIHTRFADNECVGNGEKDHFLFEQV